MSAEKIILFDGVCNFCNSSVNFVLKRDKNSVFKFAPIQSDFAQNLLSDAEVTFNHLDSFILVDNGKLYTKTTGALRVCKSLSGLWPLLYGFIIVPAFLRDPLYNLLAKYRYQWFGKADNCMIPTAEVKAKFIN
jgi:predicted DCC family thiol-disulfide oxidoreductase YuxK